MTEGNIAQAEEGILLGHVVDGHEIVRLLGAGGMGEVYLARHPTLGMQRAIKVIHDDHRGNAHATARFRREAEALSRLQHHNIVQIINFGALDNGWPYLCMEYVEGRDLEVTLEQGGPMGLADALEVLAQLARVLDYAHRQGIVHRDLKPANAILRHGDPRQLKVIDFGLAHVLSKEAMTRLTADQQLLGSPLFMAPEQADGSPEVTGAADVYALAGIAYTLLSGLPVFPDRPLLALIYAHASEAPERLSTRMQGLPPLLDNLLFACLAKKPAERPSAEELAAHFTNLARNEAAKGPPAVMQSLSMASTMAASAAQLVPQAVAAAQAAVIAAGTPMPAPADVVPTRAVAGAISMDDADVPTPKDESQNIRISDSLAEHVERRKSLVELFVDMDPGADDTGMRDALVTQGLAIINDIAGFLASSDPAIAGLQSGLGGLEQEIGDAEMDLALIEADLQDTSPGQAAAARARYDQLLGRCDGLRKQRRALYRQLIGLVDRARRQVGAEMMVLYDELDGIVARLEQ